MEHLLAETIVEEADNPSHWYENHEKPPSPRRSVKRRIDEEIPLPRPVPTTIAMPPAGTYVKVSKADIDGTILAVDRTQVAVSHGIKIFESAFNAFKEERSRLEDIKEALHGMSSSCR